MSDEPSTPPPTDTSNHARASEKKEEVLTRETGTEPATAQDAKLPPPPSTVTSCTAESRAPTIDCDYSGNNQSRCRRNAICHHNLVCASLLECCVPASNGTDIYVCMHGSYTQNDSRRCCDSTCQVSARSKGSRRKPGARECMQISRRFGVEVIPQKYKEMLLDYCKRGKVEHLIRMRERLDVHARFLSHSFLAWRF